MEDSWGPRGSTVLRRRPVGGGGPPEGPLETPMRSASADALNDLQEEQTQTLTLRSRSRAVLVSCYTATLSLLFLACAIGGCFLGVYISKPQLKVFEASVDASVVSGTFHMKVEGSFLKVGGHLFFPFNLRNSSSINLSFSASEFNIYFYPVGASRQCLLYHGGTLLGSENPAFKFRQKFGAPTNGSWVSFTTPDNEISVRASEGQDGTTARLDLPWHVGLSIPTNSAQLLQEVKPLIDDCVAYKSLILGIEITKGFSISFLSEVKIPGPIHVVQAVSCDVSNDAKKAVETMNRTYTPIFLQGLENDPTIFPAPPLS